MVNSMLTAHQEHAKSFTTIALEAYQWDPLFQYVQVSAVYLLTIPILYLSQINLQENPLKGFLVSMFLSSIRTRIPVHLQSTYLVSRQNMEYLREPMGMVNKHIGYIYLVDENCKIRWAGCGFAMGGEDLSLRNCTRVLLQRLSKETDVSKDFDQPPADSAPISSPE